jgi:hypothetical protein
MKYNLRQTPKNWIETLAIETETAVSQLDFPMQNNYRHAVAINLNKLIKNQNSNNNTRYRREWNIIKKIKQELNDNSL